VINGIAVTDLLEPRQRVAAVVAVVVMVVVQ
jgi:hypothetical protein